MIARLLSEAEGEAGLCDGGLLVAVGAALSSRARPWQRNATAVARVAAVLLERGAQLGAHCAVRVSARASYGAWRSHGAWGPRELLEAASQGDDDEDDSGDDFDEVPARAKVLLALGDEEGCAALCEAAADREQELGRLRRAMVPTRPRRVRESAKGKRAPRLRIFRSFFREKHAVSSFPRE